MGAVQLFLVRVWERDHEFHAAVRTPDEEEPRLFTDAQAVAEFLRRSAAQPAPEGGSDDCKN